jgi:hypothetical protein
MIQRVIVSNYDEYGDPVEGVGIDSNSVLAIDVQSRLQSTIQTHNAVSVAINGGTSDSSWIDTDGFDKAVFSCLNDAATNSYLILYWSTDGTNIHSSDTTNVTNSLRINYVFDTKMRYVKLRIVNTDTGAAHTMSAWAYLKA